MRKAMQAADGKGRRRAGTSRAAALRLGAALWLGAAALADVAAADWGALSAEERRRIAEVMGHDGPVRDGLFAWTLDRRPDLRRAFQRLYGPPLPTEPPAAGDWKNLTDDQRRAVALLYGYDGPLRDDLFTRHLADRPALEADFRRRHLPDAPSAPAPPGARPACGDDRAKPPAARRTAAAAAFGYETPLRRAADEEAFARSLDAHPDLRRAFQRLYGPPLPTEPPAAGDWKNLTDDQRRAVALLYGYDGPVRDGLFARHLADRPVLEADFRRRHLPDAAAKIPDPPAPFRSPWGRVDWSKLSEEAQIRIACAFGLNDEASGPMRAALFAWALDQRPDLRRAFQRLYGPLAPVEPPVAGDWKNFTDDQRRAVALSYGYDGPVRDGLFARYLADRPALAEDHRRRYLPDAPPAGAPAAVLTGSWRELTPAGRRQAARAFGYDRPLQSDAENAGAPDPGLAAALDAQPDLRRAFHLRFGPLAAPESPPSPPPPVAVAKPPPPAPTVKPAAPPQQPSAPPQQPSAASPPSSSPPIGKPPPPDPRQSVFLLAGSFKTPANAEVLARRLSGMGYKTEIGDWRDSKGGVWRVVRVGPFNPDAARTAAAALAAAGVATTPTRP